MQKLHLINNFWVYVIPFLFNFMHIVIIRTFIQGIPEELEEAARIDGLGDFQIFMRIILPLSGPVLATISLFVGVMHWNDWFTGTYYVSNKSLIPVQTLLQQMLTEAEALSSSMQRAAQQVDKPSMSARRGLRRNRSGWHCSSLPCFRSCVSIRSCSAILSRER